MSESQVDLGNLSLSRDEPSSTTHADVKGRGTCSDIKEVRKLTRVWTLVKNRGPRTVYGSNKDHQWMSKGNHCRGPHKQSSHT